MRIHRPNAQVAGLKGNKGSLRAVPEKMRASRLKALAPALLLASGILIGLLSSEVAYRVARRFVCLTPGGNIFEARPWG